ncbi:MAG: ABC transporter permease [Candidatus Moranbacteria bacterium]|nr:ABC transporter permease [Candidatus Moranbacteria bacterium]
MMRFSDIFKLSIRMFRARTSRTLLTILGMSIGIGAILLLVSLGYGLQKTLLEKITTADSLLTLDVSEANTGSISLNKAAVEKIKNMEGVEEVSPAFQILAQGSVDNISADMNILGTTPEYLKLGGVEIDKGEMLSNYNKDGIVITSALAGVLGKETQDFLGKEIAFTYYIPKASLENEEDGLGDDYEMKKSERKFFIIGTIQSDASMAYVHADSLSELNIDKYSQVKVKCRNTNIMSSIRNNILTEGFLVSSLSDTVDQANQIFNVVKIILMLFGVVALVVSAIGMFNTMTIALLERTEEIGIMKSIGASNTSISMMFMMESTIMGFLGGIMGILIGLIGGEIFDFGVNIIASRFGGETVDLFYTPLWFIGLIIGFAAVVGFMTGVVPARRASSIDPLDALRYK